MTPLQALCAHYGVHYALDGKGKPAKQAHKYAVPLSRAASNGNFRITFSNLTESRGDIWVEARWGGCWRWATSAYDHDLWDVFSVLIEGAENAGRLHGMADANAEMFAEGKWEAIKDAHRRAVASCAAATPNPTPIPEALVSAFQ